MIVSYNTLALTVRAVESALSAQGVGVEVWVVDNASTDGSVEALRDVFPEVRVVPLAENMGFGRANNVVLDHLGSPFVLLLNSDAAFKDVGGLSRLLAVLVEEPDVGVVGPRLEGPDGRLEFSARPFPGILPEVLRRSGLHRLMPAEARGRWLGTEFHDHARRGDVGWLTGACLLVRGEVIRQVGGFDPAIFLYGEELEWSWRVRRAGWRIVFEPGVTVVHHRGASGGAPSAWKSRLSMAGDAYAVRIHRGWLYLVGFCAARSVALLGEALVQGVLGLFPGQEERRARAAHAAHNLGAWISALARGGARRPAALAAVGRPA